MKRAWQEIVFLGVLVAAEAGLRTHLLDIPLMRDEGEYAYAGQLLLQGIAPYQLAYNMKMPGIYMAYAGLLALFGQSAWGIHLGLLCVNAATTVLFYLLCKRLINPFTARFAAVFFAVVSCTDAVKGVFANAEHFVLLSAVAGLLVFFGGGVPASWRRVFGSGVLFGLAFIVKQHGLAFGLFAAAVLLVHTRREGLVAWRRWIGELALLAAGMVIPFGLVCLWLWGSGSFGKFWFWTIHYAQAYASQVPLEQALGQFRARWSPIYRATPALWWLSGIGLLGLPWQRGLGARRLCLGLFALFSALSILPGFFFRPHYFALLTPAASLFAALVIRQLAESIDVRSANKALRALPLLVALAALGHSLWVQGPFLFKLSPAEAVRASYGLNPFPESLEVGRYLRRHTKEDDRIAVIGSEPQIYFYARRKSATGYIYTYPLMEQQPFAEKMQREMIAEIEASAPEYLVYVNVIHSWMQKSTSPTLIFEWFDRYAGENYELAGFVEIGPTKSVGHWEEHAPWPPASRNWVAVFRRKSS